MCNATVARNSSQEELEEEQDLPLKNVLEPPSFLARMTCVSILGGVSAVWGKYTFVEESAIPGAHVDLHHWIVPLALTSFYLVSLPLLRWFSNRFLSEAVDVKMLLREAMVAYNAGQVLLNLWMVYRFFQAVLFRRHPFIGGPIYLFDSGATYAVWVHYCDKYLEFFDTYFMVLRGKMDQVSLSFCSIVRTRWGGCCSWSGLFRLVILSNPSVPQNRFLFFTFTITPQLLGHGGQL